jgi:hypothetical protein
MSRTVIVILTYHCHKHTDLCLLHTILSSTLFSLGSGSIINNKRINRLESEWEWDNAGVKPELC